MLVVVHHPDVIAHADDIPREWIRVEHATRHNLRDISLDIPLGVLTVATGVAGSGKSTLFAQELPRRHPDFTVIDQQPLRGGTRSTVATVLGIADPIRALFVSATGLDPSWFSANGRGACPTCRGKGAVTTDLAFLDDVTTTCEACDGTRFNPAALAAPLHQRTIADVPTRLVLDEPTAGLHPQDVDVLLDLFDTLVDQGGTVIAVEHNPRVIAHADHLVDLGPGTGNHGGTIVYQGPPDGITHSPESLTGKYFASLLGHAG